ncbi:MAG: M23 family metallopeptidase [Alphaproteobacteria bacterium]|nr:M23 family metallopeptidase [Alphaproteobacteria bacterium]
MEDSNLVKHMKKIWIVISGCILAVACSAHKVPVVPSYQQIPVIQVRKDDTLYSLAKRYDTSVQELIDKNDIADPTALQPGQDLTLPHPITVPIHYTECRHDKTVLNVGTTQNKINADRPSKTQDTKTLSQGQNKLGQKVSVHSKAQSTSKQTNLKASVQTKTNSTVSAKKTTASAQKNAKTTQTAVKTKQLDKPFVATGKVSFDWPVKGKILSGFGSKGGGVKNDGINISAKKGTSIKAAEAGIVVYAGNELKGYGNLLLLRHEKGFMTAYAHADKIYVETGQVVAKGDKIASVGTTGNVKTPQLHFEIRKKTKSVDPKKYLH